jgi:hypothetical protein
MRRRWISPLGWTLAALGLLAGPVAVSAGDAGEPPGQSGSAICDRCGRPRPGPDAPKPSGPYRSRRICAGCGQDAPIAGEEQRLSSQSVGASAQGAGMAAAGAAGAYGYGTPEAAGAPGAGSELSPSAAATAAAAAAAAEAGPNAASLPTGLGEGMGGAAGALVMFGDQGTIFGAPQPPGPPFRPRPGEVSPYKAETVLPWARGYKICEDMSPIPQDRVFFNFNYYDNVNYAVNGRFHAPIGDIQAYRYFFGFEKTFWNGQASFGLRDTVNAISANSPVPGLGGSSSSMGDLNLFFKLILFQNWEKGQPTGDYSNLAQFYRAGGTDGYLVSTGMSLGFPSGPASFAGAPNSLSYRNTNLQPFVGYFARRGDFYVQGFEGIAVPLDARDVTMLYNDIGMGYFVYRSANPGAIISAIAPTFELHVNVPLNHSDPSNLRDPVGTATVVDLTYGVNVVLGSRTLLSMAIVTPISGPRPYNMEVMTFLNYYFGGSRRRGPVTSPTSYGG